jgi:Zn-dependent protease
MGTLMIIMSSIGGFGFGWGRPVQVNPVRLKYGPAVGMGIVAIAGPVSNMLLALLFTLVYHGTRAAGVYSSIIGLMCFTFVIINVSLALFNLIPIFPLDGFRVALAILRLMRGRAALQLAHRLEDTAAYGPILFLLLIFSGNFLPFSPLNFIVGQPTFWIVRLLGFL